MPVALRILVSAALLGFVLWQVDWQGVLGALARAEWEWLAVALLAFNGSMILASRRWGLIVSASGADRLKMRAAVAATYISLWLSNFLPTAFGGDVARVVTARRAGARLPVALSGAVLDRYVGLTTLAFLFVLLEASLAAAGRTRPWLPVAAFFAAGFGLLLASSWTGAHVRMRRRWLRARAIRFVARATGLLRALGARPALCGHVLAASVAATMLGVAAYWGAIRCVSASVGFPVALAVAALGTLASVIPISVSGWGVREGTVALVLSESGALSPSDASLVAILNGIVIAVTSLLGLAISLAVGWQWRASAHDGRETRVA